MTAIEDSHAVGVWQTEEVRDSIGERGDSIDAFRDRATHAHPDNVVRGLQPTGCGNETGLGAARARRQPEL